MLLILFILLHFILCCISYWLYKSDSLFTFLIFLAPFYFSFTTFKFFDLKKIVVIPGKYKASLISGSVFFLALILTFTLLKWLPQFVSADRVSIIIPSIFSFLPVLLFNKVSFTKGLIFLVVSSLGCYYFMLNNFFNVFLLLDRNVSMKGDTIVLSFISSFFICHVLSLLIFGLDVLKPSGKLAD